MSETPLQGDIPPEPEAGKETACRYCGHVAARISDEDCPAKGQTFGSVLDKYTAAEEVARQVGWEVASDITPGTDDWVRLVDAADTISKIQTALRRFLEVTRMANRRPGAVECPHGNIPAYPAHARWCDQCFEELEALAGATP